MRIIYSRRPNGGVDGRWCNVTLQHIHVGNTIDPPPPHKLCSYPSSLLDSELLMRPADKADLQNWLIKKVPECVISDPSPGVVYVLDGGSMLCSIHTCPSNHPSSASVISRPLHSKSL